MNDRARCIPILASLNLDETELFYGAMLGFAVTRHADYLLAKRDEMELHFWLTDDPVHPRNTACYIRGGQVPALHAEFAARAMPGLSDFEVRPWDMKEFTIHDPHGNLLRFGCAPQEIGEDHRE